MQTILIVDEDPVELDLLRTEDGVALLAWMRSQPALLDVEVVVHSAEFAAENIRRGKGS